MDEHMGSAISRSGAHRKGRVALALAVGLAATAFATACSSSGGPTATGSGGASQPTGSDSELAKALAAAEAPPTSIGLPALAHQPPAGKTIVFLTGGAAQIKLIGDGVKAAASAVGWKERDIVVDQTNPSSIVAGFRTALQYHPVATVIQSVPVSEFSSVLPAYQKAGVGIIVNTGDAKVQSPIIASIAGDKLAKQTAKDLATWLTVTSGGKGHVMVTRTDGVQDLVVLSDSFTSDLKSMCPGCSTDFVTVPLSAALGGQANSLVVSALRRAPKDTYVFENDGALYTGMRSSLNTAGLNDVKIMSATGSIDNESAVNDGSESVTSADPTTQDGWMDVDAAIRFEEKVPLPAIEDNGGPARPLIVKESNLTPAATYGLPTNYPQQYKAVWKVG